jgi:hypothetical protein
MANTVVDNFVETSMEKRSIRLSLGSEFLETLNAFSDCRPCQNLSANNIDDITSVLVVK